MVWWAFRIGTLLLLLGIARWWWPWVRTLPSSLRQRRVRAALGGAVALGAIGFVALQWVPYGWDHENPPVLGEPAWPGQEARAVVMRSCGDCHSNETEWPWHTNIAPGSWIAYRDVQQGRHAFNVSEWVAGTETFEDYVDEATEAVEEVEDGDMPPGRYLLIHPGARLHETEERALIEALRATFGDRRADGGRGGGSGRN